MITVLIVIAVLSFVTSVSGLMIEVWTTYYRKDLTPSQREKALYKINKYLITAPGLVWAFSITVLAMTQLMS